MADTPTISNGVQLRAPDPAASNGMDLEHATRTVETGETFSEGKADRSSPTPTAPAKPEGPPPRDATTSRRVASVAQREKLLHARERELQAREEELLSTNPQYAEQIAQTRQIRALQEHTRDVVEYVKQHSNEYEMTNLLNRHEEVAQLQFVLWQKTGRLITAAQAAQQIESFYASEFDQIASKRRPKVDAPRTTGPTRTLSSSPRRAPDFTDNRPHDEADRMRRAVAAWDAIAKRNRHE